MEIKNEISLQIFGLRDSRWSCGNCQVHSKPWMIALMFICACKCCADVGLLDSTECACKCTFSPLCGSSSQMFSERR